MLLSTKIAVLLAALAGQVVSVPTVAERAKNTAVSLSPFMDLDFTLQPPTFTSDFGGKVGLFKQIEPHGKFNGQLNGTVPPVGNFELNYPPQNGANQAYGVGSFVLNTTEGETILLRVQGPIVLEGATQSATGNLFATIQTEENAHYALNWKSFLFAFNGSQSDGIQSGGGTVYEVIKS